MGSSVTKAVKVMAIPYQGGFYYLMKEETYEKNEGPHDARWDPVYFGTLESCLKHMVQRAALCEGGSVQGVSGWITPSTYIQRWRKAFANPVSYNCDMASIRMGNGLYELKETHRATVLELMRKHGVQLDYEITDENRAAVLRLQGCGFQINKQTKNEQHFKLLLNEMGVLPFLAELIEKGDSQFLTNTWKFFETWDGHLDVSAAAVTFTPQKEVVDTWQIYHLKPSEYEIQRSNGKPDLEYMCGIDTLQFAGSAHEAHRHFYRCYIAEREAANPGVAESLIKQFRVLLANASQLPDTATMLIAKPDDTSCYARKWPELLAMFEHDLTSTVITVEASRFDVSHREKTNGFHQLTAKLPPSQVQSRQTDDVEQFTLA